MFLQSKKDDFLANVVNKQQFIYLLSEKLQQAECTTVHATGDSSIYSSRSVIILGHQLGRHWGIHKVPIYTPYAAKIGVWIGW